MPTPFYSEEDINLIVKKFYDRAFSKSEWTHEAHLIVGIWFLKKYSFYDAICRLKSGIMSLNLALHTENTANSGYHETMTVFWAKVIAMYLNVSKETELKRLVNEFLNSALADRMLPFEFYNKHMLLSKEHRTIYVSEEIKEIDEPTIKSILSTEF